MGAAGGTRGMIAGAAPTPKAVALVLLPATVLMLAFAFSYGRVVSMVEAETEAAAGAAV
jgi:hypothetical protein